MMKHEPDTLPNHHAAATLGGKLHENEANSWLACCIIPRQRNLVKNQNDMAKLDCSSPPPPPPSPWINDCLARCSCSPLLSPLFLIYLSFSPFFPSSLPPALPLTLPHTHLLSRPFLFLSSLPFFPCYGHACGSS